MTFIDGTVTCDRSDHDHISLVDARTCAAGALTDDDRAVRMTIADLRADMPTSVFDTDRLGCPVCGCRKSGDAHAANSQTGRCESTDCRCHRECGMCGLDDASRSGICAACWPTHPAFPAFTAIAEALAASGAA